MNIYFVELDGINTIQSHLPLEKGNLITLYEDGDTHHYRIRNKEEQNLTLRLVKTLESSSEGVKYQLDHLELFFENRLSKNQIIVVDEYPYKVLEIEKGSNNLTLEAQDRVKAHVLYGVYESKFEDGLDIRDREKGEYKAEVYFQSWGEVFGYVMRERGTGRKVSL